MKIEHIAIWTAQLEKLKTFYEIYFAARASSKYVNEKKHFESYFLTFPSGETRLEIMSLPSIKEFPVDKETPYTGYAHLAVSVNSKEKVDYLTTRLKGDGYTIIDGPRFTGDGYYESVILDPDGNRVEITI